MKYSDSFPTTLSRRRWLLLAGVALTGCGGGGSASLAGLPGTGGTGYTQGSITGFGSVIINGIKFDVAQANVLGKVLVDGRIVDWENLRIGMIAGVQGERNAADPALGTASSVEVWSIARGPVTRVGIDEFDVAGMTVRVDSASTLDGISSVADLLVGTSVVVWGLQAGSDGGHWSATRVEVAATGTGLVSTGLVGFEDQQRRLNGWTLSGTAVQMLTHGALVRVEGGATGERGMMVTQVTVLNTGFDMQAPGEMEVEGVVTSAPVAGRFVLGNISVDASSAALAATLSQITTGVRLEVYGRWSAGVLVASQIKAEGDTVASVEISARIDTFTGIGDFVMHGQRCDASNASFANGLAGDLKAGIKVKVVGSKDGEWLRVSKVNFNVDD